VFDPLRFPYAADAPFHPAGGEIATADYLGQVLDAYGVAHALIVGPNSGYNLDNRCLLDALVQGAGRYRGIVVLRADTGRDELQALQAAGVVGVAFQVAMYGTGFYSDIGPLLERMRDLGLWADVQVQHDQLVALRPLLEGSGVRLVFDHCGRPDPAAGVGQAGFAELLSMAASGRAAVKLSSFAKASVQAFPHNDAWPFVQALVEAYTPQALVWGSDWPFLRPAARVDYGTLLALFEQLVPDAAERRAIQWDTPRRLFGFGG
jgi:predicted TIM-barrel fold metal-dependent hydrolase